MPSLRQLFLQHIAQTSETPLMLEIERAEGSYLFDTHGKAYLDLVGGISVSILGHRHPAVVQAVRDQLDKYLHTIVYGEFVLSPQVKLAELLSQSLRSNKIEPEFKSPFGYLDSVYYVNSGSEATEGAMKLAKRFTGRSEIAAFRYAYHGSTQGAASLMSPSTYTQAYHPLLPGIRRLDFNKEEDLSLISEKTACVVVETVQAEVGVRKPEKNFLKKLRRRCSETGALLVFDEIQVGFGRTGTLWAFEQFGIEPDILLLAKGMGGGMPIGAFIAPKEITKHLSFDPPLGHVTTFGGHPVSCAAALATLSVLLKEKHIQEVPGKERLFHKLLDHPAIVERRSAGLLMAIEMDSFETMRSVMKYCLENGVITDWFLFNDRSLRIAPPLTISADEINLACKVILQALDHI